MASGVGSVDVGAPGAAAVVGLAQQPIVHGSVTVERDVSGAGVQRRVRVVQPIVEEGRIGGLQRRGLRGW